VVPHHVDPETLKNEDVMLQMRVAQPLEQAVSVEVVDEDGLICRRSLRYARPGEMVSITLRSQHYDKVSVARTLKVRVVPR
ncbi:MAG: hypothetical protein P1S60_09010, partial [Anaerolineae bacterium]|nr:hypothetical protein [Anaerolineae bacterium]